MKKSIACYLSSHGYGHAVRSLEVVRALARLRPDLDIHIICAAPPFLFEDVVGSAPHNVFLRGAATDFGLVQQDPRTFSLAATAKKLKSFLACADRVAARERQFLERVHTAALWCDIPFLPFEAAARLGLPAVGMGNFSWDWIYGYYQDFDPVFAEAADRAKAAYGNALLYLELPHSPPPAAFPRREKIPLVTRVPRFAREEARARLGLAGDACAVLLGFSELALDAGARARIDGFSARDANARDFRFIVPAPMRLQLANAVYPAMRAIPKPDSSGPAASSGLGFSSLAAAADVLVTKLGYGIVSDAVVNGVPLVYTDRGDFPELPYLEALVRETVGGVFLGREDFEAGRWAESIEAALALRHSAPSARSKEPLPLHGAEFAARRFLAETGV